MPSYRRARILVALWGAEYVDLFLSAGLPALLASGNLPALSRQAEVILTFLCRETDRIRLAHHPLLTEASRHATIRYVAIDDLLPDPFAGIALTHAYHRGVEHGLVEDGAAAAPVIFQNGDFVLGDGGLIVLWQALQAGHRAIAAPSLRCVAEKVLPELQGKAPQEDVWQSRRLIGLALKHPHPTVQAATVNQVVRHTAYPNQFYWRLEDGSLLARHYLMFMLAIVPEGRVEAPLGFCDYAFFEQYCSGEDVYVIEAPEQLFLLELQNGDYESAHFRVGPLVAAEAAEHVSAWSTAMHRRFADRLFFYPAGAAGRPTEPTGLTDFIATLKRHSGAPQPALRHPFWRDAVAASMARRQYYATWPRSTEPPPASIGHRLFAALAGRTPQTGWLHYDHADYQLMRQGLTRLMATQDHLIFVAHARTPLDHFLTSLAKPPHLLDLAACRPGEYPPPQSATGYVLYLDRDHKLRLAAFLRWLESHGAATLPGCIILHNAFPEEGQPDFMAQDIAVLRRMTGSSSLAATCPPWRRQLRIAWRRAATAGKSGALRALALLPPILLANLLLPTDTAPASSLLLEPAEGEST